MTVWEPPSRLASTGFLRADRRDRNRMGWTTLLPHFPAAVEG
ncbi:hypothetical protein [Modestobacter marinus]|nr:hypothetical protein [Modestobacter marinus]